MATTTWPAEIYVYSNKSWVSISPHGMSTLPPATGTTIGGVIVGAGINVAPDGTISVTHFSGDYNDLTNKPIIPAPVQSDWLATGGDAFIVNKPNYLSQFTNDLSVSAFPNDALYVDAAAAAAAAPIQSIAAGANVAITDDGHGNIVIAATGGGGGTPGGGVVSVSGTAPIKVVDGLNAPVISLVLGTGLKVNSGALEADFSGLATVATSGSYSDLSGKPTIPSKTSQLTNDSSYITLADVPADKVQSVAGRTGAVTLTAADIGGLANVATSGSYNDLSDKPTIPPAYTLPTASGTVLGGVKVGTGLTMTGEVLSATGTTVPDASTTAKGIIQIADAAAITAGTALRAVDAAGLKTVTDQQTKDFVNVSGDTMTGTLTLPAGSAAAPSLKLADSTGLSRPAANTIAISTDAKERMRIGPDGTMGIGIALTSKNTVARVNTPIGGASSAWGWRITSQVQADVTADAIYYGTLAATASADHTARLTHYHATSGTVASACIQQVGFWATAQMKGAKQNIGFRGDMADVQVTGVPSNYNFYAGGTAPSYFAGRVGIGTNEPESALAIGHDEIITIWNGTAAKPPIAFRGDEDTGFFSPSANTWAVSTAGAERLRVKSTGGVKYVPLATAPATPDEGEVYFDSTTKKLRVYDGTAWVNLH